MPYLSSGNKHPVKIFFNEIDVTAHPAGRTFREILQKKRIQRILETDFFHLLVTPIQDFPRFGLAESLETMLITSPTPSLTGFIRFLAFSRVFFVP